MMKQDDWHATFDYSSKVLLSCASSKTTFLETRGLYGTSDVNSNSTTRTQNDVTGGGCDTTIVSKSDY